MNIRIFLFHPSYESSLANKRIIEGIEKKNKDISVYHVDSLYAQKTIDIETEQEKLVESDIIIFQFPLYWYSVPGMMKSWFDNVMVYGFAFGADGDKLKGKSLILSLTTGATEESYTISGRNGHKIEDYFLWIEQLGRLTQMKYQGIIVSYGYSLQAGMEYIEQTTSRHVERLYDMILQQTK